MTAIGFMLISQYAVAQSGITAIQTQVSSSTDVTTYTANGAPSSPLSGNTYTYTFASNTFTDHQLSLQAIEAGSKAFAYEPIPVQVVFRRVNNSGVSNPRDLMYYFGNLSGSTINLKAPYEPNMSTAFTGNTNLLRGSDNLFANTGDGNGNINNIERLDVLVPGGISLTSASGQGFAVMERGAVNQHDAFVVGVITALDGSGNPAAYSNLIRVNSTHYGSVNVIPNQNSVVLRRDNGTGNLLASTSLSGQGIGGVFLSFADFGLSDGQTIYGYSLAAADFPASGTSADFTDYTNTTFFPLNTSGSTQGGLDMIALTGLVRILSISGQVFHDPDGLTNSTIDGASIQAIEGNPLYVNILNASNQVVKVAAVQPDGSFYAEGLPFGSYNLQLSINPGTVGSPAPAKTTGSDQWVYTGSSAGNGAPDLNLEGVTSISLSTENITGIKFGVEQRPVASSAIAPEVPHPGDNVPMAVSPALFSASDPDGSVTELIISSFPTNASSVTINGTTYTSGSFPLAGVSIPALPNGNPAVPISIASPAGTTEIVISFYAVDNAGVKSLLPATVTLQLGPESSGITNLFPATGFGTLAFEDLWPAKGDYDFNDMVIDYQFEISSNNLNFVEQIKATFVLKAFGASFENGFGFQFDGNVQPVDVLSVAGNYLTDNIITLDANGTEAGQSKPTFILFDNAFAHMPHPGTGIGVNTTPGAPYVNPVTMELLITFKPNTVSINDLDIGNFNPFIIVDKNRAVEVHLPGYPPTDLADPSKFGQWDDASNPAQGKYYVTENNLPWAIHIYESFAYPIEKQDITGAHLKLAAWAVSGGVQFPDWYKNLPGYRNEAVIYQIPTP
ncbi:MAG: LruC domain-containing protein [Bacteroidetes bacterium]|nr:LruC domain-containing protein [Bacteroidota bacterium]